MNPSSLVHNDNNNQQDPLWRRLVKKIVPLRPPITQNPKYELPETSSGNTTTPTDMPIQPEPPIVVDDKPIITDDRQCNLTRDVLLIEPIPVPVLQRQESINVFPIFVSGMTLATVLLSIPFFLL